MIVIPAYSSPTGGSWWGPWVAAGGGKWAAPTLIGMNLLISMLHAPYVGSFSGFSLGNQSSTTTPTRPGVILRGTGKG
jgi:hypothetical protein